MFNNNYDSNNLLNDKPKLIVEEKKDEKNENQEKESEENNEDNKNKNKEKTKTILDFISGK